jgi:dihydropteroate synthase
VHDLLQRVARQQSAALMGIVNVTPDSFFDGGRHETLDSVRQRVERSLADGADILDIGGESSKPGAPRVPASVQIERIALGLAAARSHDVLVSIDTADPDVARFALGNGAHIINDVTCLSAPELASVVARSEAYLLLSHARGHQSQISGFSERPDAANADIAAEVRAQLERARELAVARGVRRERVWFDPGLGFSKNARHSLELLRRVGELGRDGTPICVGTGRKSFIGKLMQERAPRPKSAETAGTPAGELPPAYGPADRLGGTIAASLWASRHGAQIVRVHDVAEVRQALLVDAVLREAVLGDAVLTERGSP